MAVKHPSFLRNNANRKLRLKTGWRKPRGIDSKQRQKLKHAGAIPRIGWGGKRGERNLHPTGKEVVLVSNESELKAAPKGALLQFSAKLGAKKASALLQTAKKEGFKVLNPRKEGKKSGTRREKSEEKKKTEAKEAEKTGKTPEKRAPPERKEQKK